MLLNESWEIKKFGPRYFTATARPSNKLCAGEHRIYYSLDAIERDFGQFYKDVLDILESEQLTAPNVNKS